MCKTLQEFIFERRTEKIELSILLEYVGHPDSSTMAAGQTPQPYDLACKFDL